MAFRREYDQDMMYPSVEPEQYQLDPEQPPDQQAPAPAPAGTETPAPLAPVDTTGWDTDSYGTPGYTAAAGSFGDAPSGWDPTKWNDPTHQTPKYVWGRIYQEAQASGDPNWMETATQRFMQAYPGSQMISGDKIMTPWGEEVDLFRDFGGENGISWNVMGADTGGGGGFSMSAPSYASIGASNPGEWSLADFYGGGMEIDPGSNMSPQEWVDFYNRFRPKTASAPTPVAGGGGGAAGGSATTGPQAPQGGMQALYDTIGQMLNMSGDYNRGILDRRVESAREDMNRSRESQSDLLRAQLAERGILGGGAEVTAATGLEEDLGDRFAGTTRDIYADESARADQRLLETMSIASGLSGQDAQRLVDWFNAHAGRDVGMAQVDASNRATDTRARTEAGDQALRRDLGFADLGLRRDLGFGQLDLGRDEAMNAYNLGTGQLGLGYDRLAQESSWNNDANLIRIIQTLFPNTDPSQGYR